MADSPKSEWSSESATVERVDPTTPVGPVLRVIADQFSFTRPLPEAGTLVLGRSEDADITIGDPSVSRQHAKLVVGDKLTIEDLGGANGTRVGGVRIAPNTPTDILPGQAVDLGGVLLVVQGLSSPLAAPPPRATGGPASSVTRSGEGTAPSVVVAEPSMKRLFELAARVASSPISVLLLGETGTGKEVLAAHIHHSSPRASGPFVQINCGALPENLLESELFGHEKGSFTGADRQKPGLLETANHGTILFDEIGEMPLNLQVKLLRVLETREVKRVGGDKSQHLDIRFIAATNRDLRGEAAAGRFRQDLFFRLDGLTLLIPPLRERPVEIALLAEAFIARTAEQLNRERPKLTGEALEWLKAYPWPGNVRELRNAVERAVILAGEEPIGRAHFAREEVTGGGAPRGAQVTLKDAEREHILDIWSRCSGNQSKAARELRISRNTLISRLRDYGVLPPPKDRP